MNATAQKILLVDDDDTLRQELNRQLQPSGFLTSQAATGSEALKLAKTERFDAIILDVGLPDMDGRQVCQELRNARFRAPIIMLTAMSEDEDTVKGLNAGANDYVTKPFEVNVLLARLRAQLREAKFSEGAQFRVAVYTFRPADKLMLRDDGQKVRLTEKEVAIIKYLYHAGRAVSREELLHHVWGYNPAVATHTLETHIYRLRKKIEPDSNQATILVTEAGGYKLVP